MAISGLMNANSMMSCQRHGLFLLAYLAACVAADTDNLSFFTPTPVHSIPSYDSTTTETATPSSTSSPTLIFSTLANTTVCGQELITWFYSGDSSYTLSLGISSLVKGGQNAVLTTLEGGILDKNTFNWTTVDVPVGLYTAQISVIEAGLTFSSPSFYVAESSNTSCLPSSTSSSSQTASSIGGSSSGTSASGGITGAPVVGAVSKGSNVSGGGIAGIVVGSLALVVGLLAALWLFRRCRRSSNGGAPRGGLFEKRRPKGAISISSRSGSFSSMQGQVAPERTDLGPASTAAYSLNDEGQSPVEKRQQSTTGYGVAMPKATHRSPYEHRDSLSSYVSGSTGVTASQSQHRTSQSRHSSLFYQADPFNSAPPSRRQSEDQLPVALYSSPSNSPNTRNFPNFPQDVSIASSSTPDFSKISPDVVSQPANVVVAQTISGRELASLPESSSSGSQIQKAPRRKSASARKPVPTYTPSFSNEEMELVEPMSPRSYSGGSDATGHSHYRGSSGPNSRASSSLAGNDWSSAAAHSHSPVSSGLTPNSSRSFLPHPAHASSISEYGFMGHLPELNHKSSFGERQMHVIMPDPPSKEMV